MPKLQCGQVRTQFNLTDLLTFIHILTPIRLIIGILQV